MDTNIQILLSLIFLGMMLLFVCKYHLDKLKVIFEILLIVAGIYYGHVLSSSFRDKELALEYLKFSFQILNSNTTEEGKPIRDWALETFDKYADHPLNKKAKDLLREKPVSAFIMTEKDIQKILDNDGGYQRHLDAIERSKYLNEMKPK
jgi:hypothetical protein